VHHIGQVPHPLGERGGVDGEYGGEAEVGAEDLGPPTGGGAEVHSGVDVGGWVGVWWVVVVVGVWWGVAKAFV